MVRDCSTGLIALPLLAMKFGGGTDASGAAIPIRLGAGASAVAAFDCDGCFPPLTIIGAAAGGAAATVLAGADEVELDGFAGVGVECKVISCGSESASSEGALADGSFTGAALGVDGGTTGFEAAGETLAGFAGCGATVEGVVATCKVAGSEACPWK